MSEESAPVAPAVVAPAVALVEKADDLAGKLCGLSSRVTELEGDLKRLADLMAATWGEPFGKAAHDIAYGKQEGV